MRRIPQFSIEIAGPCQDVRQASSSRGQTFEADKVFSAHPEPRRRVPNFANDFAVALLAGMRARSSRRLLSETSQVRS
jgi:hypothetical protein